MIFAGFVGYSLMITVFTPMLLRSDSPMIAADDPMSKRTILLGFLLCLYPLGQFLGSPVLGSLSDRFDRKPVLLISGDYHIVLLGDCVLVSHRQFRAIVRRFLAAVLLQLTLETKRCIKISASLRMRMNGNRFSPLIFFSRTNNAILPFVIQR